MICSDETGVHVDGRNAWNWVFQNSEVVIHMIRHSRAASVVHEVLEGHRPLIWVSDLCSAQREHAEEWKICLAHQLRDRQFAIEAGDAILAGAWYRSRVREAVRPLMANWEQRLGVKVSPLYVQRMKTRWGSCNPAARTIRLSTDLARKPRACLEYILVHELVHLLERTHNARFVALLDQLLPGWPHRRDQLNRLPVRHEDWIY